MYHLNSFHLQKNGHGNELVGGGHTKNPPKCPDVLKTSTLTSRKNSLKNARKARVFFTAILNHVTVVLTKRQGSGGGGLCPPPPVRGVLLPRVEQETLSLPSSNRVNQNWEFFTFIITIKCSVSLSFFNYFIYFEVNLKYGNDERYDIFCILN